MGESRWLGWDWEWGWAGESQEHPENLWGKKMDRERREQPSLNSERRNLGREVEKGKNGLDWQKFLTHKIPGIKLCLFHWNCTQDKKCCPGDGIQGIAGQRNSD